MPKAKVLPSLSGMIDTPDQSDEEMTTTVDSNQENAAPVKKGRGRAAAARKTKPASKRLSGGKPKATTASKKAATKRAPLKDQSNLQPSDTEEVDDFEEEVASTFVKPNARNKTTSEAPEVQKPKRKGRPPGKGKAAAVKPEVEVEPVPVITEKDGDFEYTPRQTKPNGKVVKDSQPEEAPPERIVQETQAMEVDGEAPVDDDTIVPQSTYRKANNARAGSRQAAVPVYNGHRRAGSASDTERGGDPAIRRKLGDLTQKFESLDLKYRHLREVGVKEAEANFEKLRKQSEEKAKIANDLIASLKQEVALQKKHLTEARSYRSALNASQSSLSTAESENAQLKAALAEIQTENKTLQAKLAAVRSTSVNVESSSNYKTPGSAVKGKSHTTRTVMVGSQEAARAAQTAQLKEDLYSDLTGLILRGIDRQEYCDIYDCIQTGRNGTLHFKLTVAPDTSASNYDDIEFTYLPRLDGNRDKSLLDLLPDDHYLRDEISFSRANAAKFYSRVVDTLTRRPE